MIWSISCCLFSQKKVDIPLRPPFTRKHHSVSFTPTGRLLDPHPPSFYDDAKDENEALLIHHGKFLEGSRMNFIIGCPKRGL